jgi:SAM-dependent methyltransferase
MLNRLLARPELYDAVQRLAGVTAVDRRLAPYLAGPGVVLDLGGGTGRLAAHLPPAATYVCLEPDAAKLARADAGALRFVRGDGRFPPVASGSVRTALLVFVAHHLDDAALDSLLLACRDVLRPEGRLVLVDPLWTASGLASRLLWRIDRGAYPRTAEAVRAHLDRAFTVDFAERFSVWHTYGLWACRKAE